MLPTHCPLSHQASLDSTFSLLISWPCHGLIFEHLAIFKSTPFCSGRVWDPQGARVLAPPNCSTLSKTHSYCVSEFISIVLCFLQDLRNNYHEQVSHEPLTAKFWGGEPSMELSKVSNGVPRRMEGIEAFHSRPASDSFYLLQAPRIMNERTQGSKLWERVGPVTFCLK